MKKIYSTYSGEELTKEVLDQLKLGDFVKINNEKKPMRVMGANQNFVLLIQNNYDSTYVKVIDKKLFSKGRIERIYNAHIGNSIFFILKELERLSNYNYECSIQTIHIK